MQMNNIILDKFNAGEPCVGTFTHLLSPTALRAMKQTGLDYVIVDLPPVNAVVDAVNVSKYVDGLVVVIREDHCPRHVLTECMDQLRYAKANILGFVMNGCVAGAGKRYQYYNQKYYRYGK